jgi:hypothetical protein
MVRSFSFIFLLLALALDCHAQEKNLLGQLREEPLDGLSDSQVSALGRKALEIRPDDWHHAETKNFIYHFQHNFIATPVSVEAEFYYGFIAKDLARDTTEWERKSHITIFEQPEDWHTFQASAQLEPWTGGIQSGGDLFIVRNPAYKFKGHSLAHEIAHLVVFRFFGNGVPRWLNEGYAENVALRSWSSYFRARGYLAKPNSTAVSPSDYIPLAELTTMEEYPTEVAKVEAFYHESERLVRFLTATDKAAFRDFFDALAHGNRFETALAKAFGMHFSSTAALEAVFKPYASKDYDESDSN